MPASLRLVLILFALGLVAAFGSGFVQYRQNEGRARDAAETMTGGRVDRGKKALEAHGCGSCHAIPGIAIARGRVGPSLRGVGRRSLIAGRLSNGPENMILWIRYPQHVSPGTGMPEQPMSDADARDVAAYLLTLRR
jgi:cytochrome c2